MKRLLSLFAFALLACGAASAQQAGRPRQVATKPAEPCNERDWIQATDTHLASLCQNAHWKDLATIAGGTPADTALDNLTSPTAINQDLLPGTDNSKNLGSASKRWADAQVMTLVASTSVTAPFFKSAAADPADAGAVRLGNNELIEWEKATPGTDWTLGVNASDVLQTNAPLRALTITDDGLTAGRVPIVGAAGLIQDDSDLTFATDTLTVTKLVIGGGSALTSSGAGGALGAIAFVTPGTGVAAALALNVGSAGAPVLFNGNAGTPSALVGTNISGTAASLTAGAVTGFTAGAGVLTGPASAGVAVTLGNNETITGIKTLSPTARSSGSAAYLTINVPADTGISTATESIGENHVTGTRTWVDGTVALQRERFWAGPTYNKTTTSATFTDTFNGYFTPPVAGTGVTFTRPHTLGIVDSTSASSSITGGLIVATTLGTAATSVGIGGGNINAGGNGTFGGTLNVTGQTTLTAQTTISDGSLGLVISNSRITAPSNGLINLTNNAATGFSRLVLGKNSASGDAAAIGYDAVNGITFQSGAGTATWNDGSTANSGTVANRYLVGIAAPTLTATGTSVTNTVASTVYIGGAPTDSTNTTSTTKWALNVAAGNVNIGGALTIGGHVTVEGVTSTGATGTGKFAFDTQPQFTTSIGVNVAADAMATSVFHATRTSATITTLGNSRELILDTNQGGINEKVEIGFGYKQANTNQPVVIGSNVTNGAGQTIGDFYIATRNVTTDTAPTVQVNVTGAGAVQLTGQISKYNNIATAAWGFPAIYGSGRVTAQTAAAASIATYTVGAADGSFEVSGNVLVTASTTHSITMTVTYTDEGNTSRTLTLNFSQITGTMLTAITNVQGVGAYEGVSLHIRCKASTSITFATAGTFTSVTYNAEGIIKQIS